MGKNLVFKKIIAVMLSTILVCALGVSVKADSQSSTYTDSIKEYEACLKDNAIREALSVMTLSDEEVDFSGVFGGSYIDDANNLVVLLTDLSDENVSYFDSLIDGENVIYSECAKSLNYLNALKQSILDYYLANASTASKDSAVKNIVAVGIYENQNKVFVSLNNYSDVLVEEFKNTISDSEYIIFEDGSNSSRQTFNTSAAISGVSSGDQGSNQRIGFRCYKMINDVRVDGYVTCGHGLSVGGNMAFANTTAQIGTVHSSSFYSYSNSDAAFIIPISSLYTVNTSIEGTTYSLVAGGKISIYSTGTKLYLANGTSTMSYGQIVSTSVTFTDEDGITTNDLVKASYSSVPGDSGGAIVRLVGDKYYITGIHTGRTGTNYAVFSKVDNILNDLGVILY